MEAFSHTTEDILIVTFMGKILSDGELVIERYFEIVQSSALQKILLDLRRLAGRLSYADTYFMAHRLPSFLSYERTVAIVDLKQNKDYAAFHKLVLKNVGFRNLEHFYDYDEALGWLKRQ